mgnify:CR=1 FL=1
MLIFDFNQIVIASLMEQIGSSKQSVEEDLVRHMILNSIRSNVKKFKTYGEVIIACDNKNYWRKQVFPFYKGNRKKSREKSGHDWNSIFQCMNVVRTELKEHSPYKVIDIEGAEADDVIGILTKRYCPHEKIMILSSDKDFVQLQINSNVEQYSPTLKKYIKSSNPVMQLKELIICGDKGDGVPNILSNDNCIVDGIRQKALTKSRMDELMNTDFINMNDETMKRNWIRNKIMIDLSSIPENISKSIIDSYESTKPATKQKFMNYMISKRLKNLLEVIDDF